MSGNSWSAKLPGLGPSNPHICWQKRAASNSFRLPAPTTPDRLPFRSDEGTLDLASSGAARRAARDGEGPRNAWAVRSQLPLAALYDVEFASWLTDEELGLFHRLKRDDQPSISVVLHIRSRRTPGECFFACHFWSFMVTCYIKYYASCFEGRLDRWDLVGPGRRRADRRWTGGLHRPRMLNGGVRPLPFPRPRHAADRSLLGIRRVVPPRWFFIPWLRLPG